MDDVLIIGGGVIGLSIARELHLRGVGSITVLEKGVCGEEASWAAAGMLGPQAEADQMGPMFEMQCESRDLYPDFAAALHEETGVDIELDRAGTLYLAFDDADTVHLKKRFEWQRAAGLPVEELTAADAMREEPEIADAVQGALYFPGDWQVENRKLVEALQRFAELNGIEVREQEPAENVLVEDGKVTGVETASGKYPAGRVVLATGAWSSHIKIGDELLPFAVEPVRGQILALHSEGRMFRHVIYSRRGYLVPRAGGRLLIGSTSENVGFDRSTTSSAESKLREAANEISPALADLRVMDQWSGLRPMAPDGLPVLGEIAGAKGLFVATAHYRNGILLAPATAQIVADFLIDGLRSRYLEHFGPDRFARSGNAKTGAI